MVRARGGTAGEDNRGSGLVEAVPAPGDGCGPSGVTRAPLASLHRRRGSLVERAGRLLPEMVDDPAGHQVGNLLDAAGAGVEGRIDAGSQGRGEALMFGDALLVPVSPGRPGSEPLGEHVIGQSRLQK